MRTLFYRLPRLTAIILLVIVFGGLGALMALGRQEDPTLTERFGTIVTVFPGADAERVEALVTDPLEKKLRELPEINELSSVSRSGVSQVSIDIDESLDETETEDAWALVRAQVEEAKPGLPEGASDPEVQRFILGASTMIVALTWEGDGTPELAVMARMAQDIELLLSGVSGTEETEIFGLPSEEIRVEMDIDALTAAGLTLRQAAGLIRLADSKAPAGELRSGASNIGIEISGEFENTARIRSVPLVQRADGSALRVGDIATVTKGIADPQPKLATINNARTIMVSAIVAPGVRVDQWAVAAKAKLASVQDRAPQGIGIDIVFDQVKYTNARLGDLTKNLGYSSLIVFLVLFLVMGWRSAIVVGLALPLTVCCVLILFNVNAVPLHQMSVTGLVISLGLLIDNAIVVVDEYDQNRNRGEARLEAMDHALKHLMGPLFASTLTTALAFAPIALLPGAAGEFVGMIGLSVIFAVVSSFLLALTVIPAMAAWFDWDRSTARKKRWWRDGISFRMISDGYRWTIEAVLRFPPLGIALGIAPAILGFTLMAQLPSQFFPQNERDQFQIDLALGPEASIEETTRVTERATELLLAHPDVTDVHWVIGEPAPRVYYNAFNNAEGVEGFAAGWVQMTSAEASRTHIGAIQAQMRAEFPNAKFLTLPYEQGPPADAPISFEIRGDSLEELARLGDEARRILAQTPGVTYTNASLRLGAPTLTFRADETTTAIAGERLVDLASDLRAELDGVLAGSVLEGVENIPVRVIAPDARRQNVSGLSSKSVGLAPGTLGTPLSAIGEITLDPDAAVITHEEGRRMNRIQAFLKPYHLPAPHLEMFMQALDESDFELPEGYEIVIGGDAENSSEAMGNLLALAIPLLIIMTGAVTLVFNNFLLAFAIQSTGMLAMMMAMVGVYVFNLPLGFNAIIGALGLFGIAINGSIVVLSLLNANDKAKADDIITQREIVVDATRHIVATTLTTMGGFVPILMTGDAFWMPLAAAIATGVAGSAILALYYIPALFRLYTMKPFTRLWRWVSGANRKRVAAPSAMPAE